MEFLAAIVGPVVGCLMEPVKKHVGYLLCSTKHVSNMTTRMELLHDTSVDVKDRMEANNLKNLVIPTHVPVWLTAVEKIKEDAERISSNVNGCFNLKMRYQTGRKAFKITEEIKALITEKNETSWSDAPIPLAKVSSKKASTSGSSDGDAQSCFKSREKVFKDALGLLQQDQKAQVIALCGMGGVGKTTMMEQLKKAVEDKKVEDKKMFGWVVKEVIGQKVNTLSIQKNVADYLGHPLTEEGETARADRLRMTFEKMSQENKKVLVILDDVWEKVELKDIGLSPLPNGFKLLLTSRNEKVCTQIAVQANSDLRVVRVDVMEELEANNFFCQITGVSKENDPKLNAIGVEIVRRCGFLPLAIRLIATSLKSEEKSVWRDTLRRLKKNDLDKNVQEIIEISYTFIKEKDVKAIFLLCGLFPDDFNIPIEDLTRYAWGHELLNEVLSLAESRDRTKTCVRNLKKANLLIDSDYSECVKMHDLVLAFVLAKVSKGDHPWSRAEMSESEFPKDLNHPNVSLLRLMNGDKSLKFPEDFYEKMENLQVIAYEKLQYPLLPRSLQCSTKLKTLCLHQCLLMFDCSPIGDHLLNLEVLSFAHSGIRYLPSAIGNLKKLKLLDLTGCIDLRIDEGVLKNLVKLEELYMRVADKKGIRFTDIIYKELAERSKNLSALEVEFVENNPQSMNMSYNKLERFKISMGCFLWENSGKDRHSFENTLKLVAKRDEVLESGMSELFQKTEVLHLEAAGGMNNLVEVLPKSVLQQSFVTLRILNVYKCADLRYLFTVPVAGGLVKLESLTVRECPVMEALVYSENGEEGVIRFQELKHLRLEDLPMLQDLSLQDLPMLQDLSLQDLPMLQDLSLQDLPQLLELDLMGLPKFTSIYPEYNSAATSVMSGSTSAMKPFFNKEVRIPKLEKLVIFRMKALKNIWACQSIISSEEVDACCLLRHISVVQCDNLVNMFPRYSMPLLQHLETIVVYFCGSIEVLFDIDDVGEIKEGGEEGVIRFQELKYLRLEALPMLVGFSNTNDLIDLPQLVELELRALPNITSIYPEYKSAATSVMSSSSSSTTKPFFNKKVMIPKLERLGIYRMEALKSIWPCGSSEEVDACLLREITVSKCDNLVNMFPRNPMPLLHHLERIDVDFCGSIEVLFDIDDVGEIKEEGGSKLRSIRVWDSGKLREVWRLKCVINHPDAIIRGFQAVEVIRIGVCKSFRNIFTPTTARFDLAALTDIIITTTDIDYEDYEDSEESEEENNESVEEIDDISKGEIIQVADNIPYVAYPFHLLPTFHHLQSLNLNRLTDVEAVFEIESATSRDLTATWDNHQPPVLPHLKNLKLSRLEKMNCVWKCSWNHFLYSQKQRKSSFQNLTSVLLERCGKIKYLLSPVMVKLLFNLKTIVILKCDGIEEVVSNRDDDIQTMAASTSSRTNPTFFPHLDSLHLSCLSKLKLIDDGGARGNRSEITSNVISNISTHDNFKSSQADVVSWSLCQYSRKIEIHECNALSTVIPFNAVGKLQKLETLIIAKCQSMREIFEIEGVNNSCHSTNVGDGCGNIHHAVTIPRLAKMILLELSNLQILQINQCDLLEYIFISSTLESLKQLKELTIEECKAMQVIVKEDDLKEDGEHTTSKVVVFPNLKSLTLTDLPNVKGFFLGMNEFQWPQLDKVKIYGCPQMMVFTSGHSMTPKLDYMHTGLGKHSLECGLNFRLTNATHETKFRCSSMCPTPDMIKLLQYPWSFSKLVEVDVSSYSTLLESRIIFPHNELHKLQNLEKLNVTLPKYYDRIVVVEVFEVVEETNDYTNETQSVVEFPKLKEVTLENLQSVRHIWRTNPAIVLKFPNLTKVFINQCPLLGNVLTSCMVGSLLQLQELHISDCENMEVIVKQVEDSDTRTNEVVVFPRLKSLTLASLQNLKGFYLGLEAFIWPSLDILEIKDCPQITVFTGGQSTTPELKVIDTSFGLCYATEDPNSFIKTKQQEGLQF